MNAKINNNKLPINLVNEILDMLDKSEIKTERSHAENTLYWVKKIRPDASIALQIAALGHDLERGISPRFLETDFTSHAEYKVAHSEKSAKILEGIMRMHNLDDKVIASSIDLVILHEVGGNSDADVLMDADSISFFDNNLEYYILYKGLAGAIRQVNYKYERCTPRAQKYIDNIEGYKLFKKQILESK
jgi:hypothetical protein